MTDNEEIRNRLIRAKSFLGMERVKSIEDKIYNYKLIAGSCGGLLHGLLWARPSSITVANDIISSDGAFIMSAIGTVTGYGIGAEIGERLAGKSILKRANEEDRNMIWDYLDARRYFNKAYK